MNKKEFEDFFKDLDPIEVPGVETDNNEDDDFSFASFFEDATTKPQKPKEEVIKVKAEPVFEDDIYEAISLKTCVEKRLTLGAPGPKMMKEVIRINKEYLAEEWLA